MHNLSLLVALAVSYVTLSELIERVGVFTSVVISTGAGFVFGMIARAIF